jgi:HSP20 family protein
MSNLVPSNWRDSAEQLRDNVTNLFDRWLPQRFRGSHTRDECLWPSTLIAQGGPAIDVVEEDNAVRVTAELPGLSEKDFEVEVRDGRLILRGEKKAGREEKKRDYYYAECSYGSFSRVVPLPCEVDGDKATANYKHGVLNVTLPKTPAAKTKRIKVDVS